MTDEKRGALGGAGKYEGDISSYRSQKPVLARHRGSTGNITARARGIATRTSSKSLIEKLGGKVGLLLLTKFSPPEERGRRKEKSKGAGNSDEKREQK